MEDGAKRGTGGGWAVDVTLYILYLKFIYDARCVHTRSCAQEF